MGSHIGSSLINIYFCGFSGTGISDYEIIQALPISWSIVSLNFFSPFINPNLFECSIAPDFYHSSSPKSFETVLGSEAPPPLLHDFKTVLKGPHACTGDSDNPFFNYWTIVIHLHSIDFGPALFRFEPQFKGESLPLLRKPRVHRARARAGGYFFFSTQIRSVDIIPAATQPLSCHLELFQSAICLTVFLWAPFFTPTTRFRMRILQELLWPGFAPPPPRLSRVVLVRSGFWRPLFSLGYQFCCVQDSLGRPLCLFQGLKGQSRKAFSGPDANHRAMRFPPWLRRQARGPQLSPSDRFWRGARFPQRARIEDLGLDFPQIFPYSGKIPPWRSIFAHGW